MNAEITAAQKTILQMTADAYPIEQIAETLNRSRETINHELRHIRETLGADNTIQAVVMAIRRKIIE